MKQPGESKQTAVHCTPEYAQWRNICTTLCSKTAETRANWWPRGPNERCAHQQQIVAQMRFWEKRANKKTTEGTSRLCSLQALCVQRAIQAASWITLPQWSYKRRLSEDWGSRARIVFAPGPFGGGLSYGPGEAVTQPSPQWHSHAQRLARFLPRTYKGCQNQFTGWL